MFTRSVVLTLRLANDCFLHSRESLVSDGTAVVCREKEGRKERYKRIKSKSKIDRRSVAAWKEKKKKNVRKKNKERQTKNEREKYNNSHPFYLRI